jgi:hypothetical protein
MSGSALHHDTDEPDIVADAGDDDDVIIDWPESPTRRFDDLLVWDIHIPPGRDVDPAAVDALAISMEKVGLRHPIVIRTDRSMPITMPSGKISETSNHLVYGRHP